MIMHELIFVLTLVAIAGFSFYVTRDHLQKYLDRNKDKK